MSWLILSGVIIVILYLIRFLFLIKQGKKNKEKLRQSEKEIEAERKLSTETLMKSEEKFYKAFNASPHIFAITDLTDGRIVEVNSAFTRLCGWSRQEAVGSNTVALNMWSLERHEAFVQKVKELQSVNSFETIYKNKAGESRSAIMSAEIIDLDGRVCCLGTLEDITNRKADEAEILESRERLRVLAQRLEEVREDERIGIARELHDVLGQSLTGLKIDLSNISEESSTVEDYSVQIQATLANIDTMIDTVRRISSQLRPPILDDLGLEAALEYISIDFSRRTGISSSLDFDCDDLPLNKAWNTAIFRIYQESLVNISRHSEAKSFKASAKIIDSALVICIKDDGKGIDQDQINNTKSIGLIGMQERAKNIGASFSIGNAQTGGVEIIIVAPLQN